MANNSSTSIKALIFDFDGTLVDTKRYYFQIIADYLNFDVDQVLKAAEQTTLSKINYKETNVKWKIINASFSASKLLGFGYIKSSKAVFHLIRTQSNNFSKARPTSNAKRALEKLSSSGIKLAILSHSSRKKIEVFLKTYLEGNRFFDFKNILASGEFGKEKIVGLNHIIKQLGVEASMCGIVGDLGGDILTGKSIGLKTFGLTTGYTCKKILIQASPDKIFEDLLGLANYLA